MNIIARQFAYFPPNTTLYTFIIALQIMRVTIFASRQDLGNESISSGVILLFVSLLANIYVIVKERNLLTPSVFPMLSLFIYNIYGCLTILWSPVPHAYSIFPKCLEVLTCFLLTAVVIGRMTTKYQCLMYLLLICTLSALLGYIPAVILTGAIFQHTCSYTIPAAMGALLAMGMCRLYSNSELKYYIWINLALTLFGTSSASYIAFICGWFIYNSSNRSGVSITKTILYFIVFVLLYYFIGDILMEYIFWGKSKGSIATATGRQFIWKNVMQAWNLNPIFGCGYIVAERNLHIISKSSIQIFSAHNGYLSVLLGTGIVGSIIFGWFLLKTFYTVLRDSTHSFYSMEMTLLLPPLVVVLINNLTVHAMGSAWYLSTPAVFILFAIIHTIKYKL